MDNNTKWREVVDFSWYTTERLNSFPETHPMHFLGRKIAEMYVSAGAEQTWAEVSTRSPDLPIVYLDFFKEALFPQKFAKYSPETSVWLIRNLLSKQYYAYEGLGTGGSDGLLNRINVCKLGAFQPWQGVYHKFKSDNLLEKILGNNSGVLVDFNDWEIYKFQDTNSQVAILSPNSTWGEEGLTIEVQGSPSRDQVMAALRVSLLMAYDPFMDIQDYTNRIWAKTSGMTLAGIRKTLEQVGVKSIARDKFTMVDGGEVPIHVGIKSIGIHYLDNGEKNNDGNGVKVECYTPSVLMKNHGREMTKLALLAWAFGQELK